MKAIIIDDEALAIDRLKKLIEADGRITVDGTFTDAEDALQRCIENSVDIIFTDVEMPKINGIELGKVLKEKYPKTILIYVTAYSRYALEAFDNYSVGYLLKPIISEKLVKLIDMLLLYNNQNQDDKIIAKTIGNNSFYYNEQQIKFRTKKAEELFCFLLHNSGKWVTADRIIDTLWRDKDISLGKKHLHTSIYYCRKALNFDGLNDVVQYKHGAYRINIDKVNWDFIDISNQLDKAIKSFLNEAELLKLITLNSTAYFGDSDFWWTYDTQALLDIKLQKVFDKQVDNLNLLHKDLEILKQLLMND